MKVTERIQRKLFTRFALAFSERFPRLKLEAVDDYYLPELVNRFFDTSSLQKGISKILLDLPAASIQILFRINLVIAIQSVVYSLWLVLLVFLLYLIFRFTAPAGICHQYNRIGLQVSSRTLVRRDCPKHQNLQTIREIQILLLIKPTN
jgi:ATP-binding cassette subfamily B protein